MPPSKELLAELHAFIDRVGLNDTKRTYDRSDDQVGRSDYRPPA